MDDVFGNSSGETVVESPRSIAQDDQNLSDYDLREDRLIHRDDLDHSIADDEHRHGHNQTINCIDELDAPNDMKKPVPLGTNEQTHHGKGSLFTSHDALVLLKKKIADFNRSQELQIEQNTENHHLEDIQKCVETKLGNDDHVHISEKCFNDISKSQNCKELKLNSGIEKYLIELSKRENFNKLSNNDINSMHSEDYFNSLNSIRKQNYQSIPRHKTAGRNTIYQLPPMPQTQPLGTANVVSSPNLKSKIQPRARANTTGGALVTRHLYQNIPVPITYRHSPIHRQALTPSPKPRCSLPLKTPTYVNVPALKAHQQTGVSPKILPTKHSYIQLWSGSKHESLSDTECDDAKKFNRNKRSSLKSFSKSPQSRSSSPGYVQMTSPYVRSPVSTVFAQLSSSLANYAGHALQTIFCPLCPRQFSYERILASHIQKTHRLELEAMIEGRPGDLSLQCCPICQARFFNSSVLPKHLIDCHKGSFVQLLEKHRCIVSNSNGMQCPFCVKCVPPGINGEHIFMFHLQQYHLKQYEDMINNAFKSYSGYQTNSNGSLSPNVKDIFGFDPGATSTPGLSGKMGSLSVISSDSKRKLEDMEMDEATWSSHQGRISAPVTPKEPVGRTPKNYEKQEPRRSVSKGILRRDKKSSDRPNVKRELRFSVPHVTKEEIYFPESPGPVTPDYRERIDLNAFSYPENSNNSNRTNGQPEDMDAITTEEFIDMNQQVSRKRRRLGLGIKSKKIFKCKDKENQEDKPETTDQHQVYSTINTKTFRRPKPVAPPKVPSTRNNGSPCAAKLYSTNVISTGNGNAPNVQSDPTNLTSNSSSSKHNNKQPATDKFDPIADNNPSSMTSSTTSETAYPFSSALSLYSPLRLFRCNGCRHKFCDNDSLLLHISQNHRSLMSLLRPQFGCGVCAAKFYENKYLVKHCLQHHTSLLEIRSKSGEEVPVLGPSSPVTKGKSANTKNAAKHQVTAL